MMRREVVAGWLAERDGFVAPSPATEEGFLREADDLLERLDSHRLWTARDVCEWTGLRSSTVSSYNTRDQMPAPELTFSRTSLWEPDVIRKWRPQGYPHPASYRASASRRA